MGLVQVSLVLQCYISWKVWWLYEHIFYIIIHQLLVYICVNFYVHATIDNWCSGKLHIFQLLGRSAAYSSQLSPSLDVALGHRELPFLKVYLLPGERPHPPIVWCKDTKVQSPYLELGPLWWAILALEFHFNCVRGWCFPGHSGNEESSACGEWKTVFAIWQFFKLSPVENWGAVLVEGDTLAMYLFLKLNGKREIVSIRTMNWASFT